MERHPISSQCSDSSSEISSNCARRYSTSGMFYIRFFTAFLLFLVGVSARWHHVENGGLVHLEKRHPFPQSPTEVITPEPLPTSVPTPTDVESVIESLIASSSSGSLTTSISSAASIQSISSSLSAASSTTPSFIQPTPTPTSEIKNGTSLATSSLPTSSFSSYSPTSTAPAINTTPLFNISNTGEKKDRTLIIVLSVVFGLLGLGTIFAIILFLTKRRRGACKHTKRGVTPIDDEEIETWRGRKESYTEESSPHSHHRKTSSTVILSHAPSWTWNPDPTAYDPMTSAETGETALSPPPMVARAPNARSGLTDGAVPSADPFVTPPRRQSTRLARHARSHSRKSSFGLSLVSRSSAEHARHFRDESKSSLQGHRGGSPPVSIFNAFTWQASNGPSPSSAGILTGTGAGAGAAEAKIGMAS